MTEKIQFDKTISLGHILSVISFILMGFAAFYGMRTELATIHYRLAAVEMTLKELTSETTSTVSFMTRTDERLKSLELAVADLKTRVGRIERYRLDPKRAIQED